MLYCNRKNMADLIRCDLITMSGGRNNTRAMAIVLLLFFGGMGFVFSPLFGMYVPLGIGSFFVPMLFQNEIKSHSERLFSVLPVSRRDLVQARFAMTFSLFMIAAVLYYLLMLLAMRLKLWIVIMGADGEYLDILSLAAEKMGGSMTAGGLFNMLYFMAASASFWLMSSALRKYFKEGSRSMSLELFRPGKRWEILLGAIVLGVIALWVLIISGILPLGSAAALVMRLFLQLSQAGNGFLLGTVALIIGLFAGIYNYICTILEYDDKEL